MLTTVERVKFRAQIQEDSTDFDDLLKLLVFSASEFIEDYLGRKLKKDTYLQTFSGMVDRSFSVHNVPLESVVYARRINAKKKTTEDEYTEGTDFYIYPAQETGRIIFNDLVNATPHYALQVSYVGGYEINFDKLSENKLPAVITDVCEQLVIGMFNHRKSIGIKTTDFQTSEIEYQGIFVDFMKQMLAPYKRAVPFAL